jgi:hypothetical protein
LWSKTNQRINLSLVVVVLLTKDIEALVIHIDLKGKVLLKMKMWVKAAVKTGTICTLDYRPERRTGVSLSQVM